MSSPRAQWENCAGENVISSGPLGICGVSGAISTVLGHPGLPPALSPRLSPSVPVPDADMARAQARQDGSAASQAFAVVLCPTMARDGSLQVGSAGRLLLSPRLALYPSLWGAGGSPQLPHLALTGVPHASPIVPSPDFSFHADEHLEVYVSATENPSHFWIQIIGQRSLQLDKLTTEMRQYYWSSGHTVRPHGVPALC